jgi:hypothetical protein
VAIGWRGEDRAGAPQEMNWGDDGPGWNLRANGGILSTAADMRRWVRALEGDDLLSPSAKNKLFDRHALEVDGGDTFYGYGWVSFPYGDDQWFRGHNGGNGIFFAALLWFPDDDTLIFVATNQAGADEDAAFRLAGLLLDTDVGAGCQPYVDIAGLPSVHSFPDGARAGAANATLALLLTGDDSDRRDFITNHVGESLARDLPMDEQLAALAGLQAEFMGYTVHMIHLQDDSTFHVVLRSDSDEAVLTIVTDPQVAEHVSCVHVEFP